MTIKINPLVTGGASIVVALLVFGFLRSCNNTNALLSEKDTKLDSVAKKASNDSADAAVDRMKYKAAKELLDGQIGLWQNRALASRDSLEAANRRINKLLVKHIPVATSADTSATTVPNAYIEDCEGCFVELKNGRDLVSRHEWIEDSLRLEYNRKMKLDSNRIIELNRQNTTLSTTLTDVMAIARAKDEKNKPHSRVLLSLSTMAINANVPNAAGFGFGYQDKYNRIFAIKYFTSEYGPIKQADVFISLSFKRRK